LPLGEEFKFDGYRREGLIEIQEIVDSTAKKRRSY
jgi:hypothetical protein